MARPYLERKSSKPGSTMKTTTAKARKKAIVPSSRVFGLPARTPGTATASAAISPTTTAACVVSRLEITAKRSQGTNPSQIAEWWCSCVSVVSGAGKGSRSYARRAYLIGARERGGSVVVDEVDPRTRPRIRWRRVSSSWR